MAAVKRWTVDDNHNVKEIHKVVVYRFNVGDDVDDPDLYAANPLWQWQQSDAGKFVFEHAIEIPSWHRNHNILTMGNEYIIVAELELKKLSEFYLRWGKDGRNLSR
jgi:hypothetical protein